MATAQRISTDESHCVLCCDDMEYTACGSCDHPICLKCCVKLRLLRKQYECPVCRTQLQHVVVSKGYKSWEEKTRKPRPHQHSRNHGIIHETPESQEKVKQLLEHKCPECSEVFKTFPLVKDHIRKVHSMTYCDICLKHLKIFTHERKCYTREDLVKHRREGDAEDKSHRGHPLCQFCDERYLDNDELLVHLRKNHFWCHLCERDGSQDYYPHYKQLRKHFKEGHFLCEEGECIHEKFTSVFRVKIDFQAHVAQKHSNRLTKAEARQVRQLDVNITFAPRENSDPGGVTSGRDYSFPEQGNERYRDRSNRSLSGTTGQDLRFVDARDPRRYKGKVREHEREARSVTKDQKSKMNSEQCRRRDMDRNEVKNNEDRKGVQKDKRSPKDVLEGDHKRPPGEVSREDKDKKRIFEDKVREKKAEKKSSETNKMAKESEDVKTRKESGKKKKLINEDHVGKKEKKSDEGLSKTNESNDSLSHLKADSKPQVKNTSNNNLFQEKNVESSLSESSSIVRSASNIVDDFPELLGNKKQGTVQNITRPYLTPTYNSEFLSLSSETINSNPIIRPPPGFAIPEFGSQLSKNINKQIKLKNPSSSNVDMFEQAGDFEPDTTKTKQPQGTLNIEDSFVKKPTVDPKARISSIPTPLPTYDSEFPTLSAFANGHKPSSNIKAPPGLAPPGFQAGIQPGIQPPPGMGWSVPLSWSSGSSSIKDTRSQRMISDIRRILNLRGKSFEVFREVSGYYRLGIISPGQYFQECCELLGEENMHKVFKELIDLLPDEEKQRQLLVVYNDAKVKAKKESSTDFNNETAISKCDEKDISQLSLEDVDFPSLPRTSGKKSRSVGKASNVWTCGK